MKSAGQIMRELVAVQSDTGTSMEIAQAMKILELIQEDEYFKSHPNLCGAFHAGDVLGRPVVWALKRGCSARTLIITGHYDCVETQCYGSLQDSALDPDALRRLMKGSPTTDEQLHRDLQDENWVFGRGTADMKGGLAAGLFALFSWPGGDVNVLFVAVSDEENLSAGARQAVGLYAELKDRFGLDYRLGVICESCQRNPDEGDPFPLAGGGPGKILPIVLVKGGLAHSCDVLGGLNSALIMAEVIRNVELSTEFLSVDGDVSNQPPATQLARDLKEHYDVSLPSYSAAAFNMTFLSTTDPMDLITRLRTVCARSIEAVVSRYNQVFEEMRGRGLLPRERKMWVAPPVITLEELRGTVLRRRPGFERFEEELRERTAQRLSSGKTLQEASVAFLKEAVEFADITPPAVVIGVAPPYYPAVSIDRLGWEPEPFLSDLQASLEQFHGIRSKIVSYFTAMTDLSYMSCADPQSAQQVMNNMALPSGIYDVDFAGISKLNTPSFLIGPAGRDIHKAEERVDLPDVERHVPAILLEIMRTL